MIIMVVFVLISCSLFITLYCVDVCVHVSLLVHRLSATCDCQFIRWCMGVLKMSEVMPICFGIGGGFSPKITAAERHRIHRIT